MTFVRTAYEVYYMCMEHIPAQTIELPYCPLLTVCEHIFLLLETVYKNIHRCHTLRGILSCTIQ